MKECRTIGCRSEIERNQPGEKDDLCFQCWSEITALQDMRRERKEKNEARRK